MGREVRRVSPDWVHPKDERGHYIPLFPQSHLEAVTQWASDCEEWEKSDKSETRDDYCGPRPKPEDYMPDWAEPQKTFLMMYENVSEGTPLSPGFETAEELARWLADNNASAFGSTGASYEAWLRVCQGGYAPSMVIADGKLMSGVEGL